MIEQVQNNDFVGNIYRKLFGGDYKQINGHRFCVSFVSVMRMKDFQMLLVCGGLIVSADRLILLLTNEYKENVEKYSYTYFIGSSLAFVAGGIYHDTLFQGRPYFTIAVICTIGVIWQSLFVTTILSFRDDSNYNFLIFMSAFNINFTEFFIRLLFPLFIASENRVTYELTSAGTLVATLNLFFYLL